MHIETAFWVPPKAYEVGRKFITIIFYLCTVGKRELATKSENADFAGHRWNPVRFFQTLSQKGPCFSRIPLVPSALVPYNSTARAKFSARTEGTMEKGYKVRSSDPQSCFSFCFLKAIWVACGAREGQRGNVRGNEPPKPGSIDLGRQEPTTQTPWLSIFVY